MLNLINLKNLALLSVIGVMMLGSPAFAESYDREYSEEDEDALCPVECCCPCEEELAPEKSVEEPAVEESIEEPAEEELAPEEILEEPAPEEDMEELSPEES